MTRTDNRLFLTFSLMFCFGLLVILWSPRHGQPMDASPPCPALPSEIQLVEPVPSAPPSYLGGAVATQEVLQNDPDPHHHSSRPQVLRPDPPQIQQWTATTAPGVYR